MPLSTAAKNLELDALDEAIATGAKFASLHTAYSATGTNEVTGGSPAYARKAATWNAAASGQKALASGVTFDVPAGTVAWIGFWDAATLGTFLGMTPASAGALKLFTVNAAGVTSNTLDAPAHGLANNTQVVVWGLGGAGLPTGLAQGTIYYVVGAATDTLQLSATSGGAAIDITAVGAGFVQSLVTETFAGQGTYTVSAGTLDATPL